MKAVHIFMAMLCMIMSPFPAFAEATATLPNVPIQDLRDIASYFQGGKAQFLQDAMATDFNGAGGALPCHQWWIFLLVGMVLSVGVLLCTIIAKEVKTLRNNSALACQFSLRWLRLCLVLSAGATVVALLGKLASGPVCDLTIIAHNYTDKGDLRIDYQGSQSFHTGKRTIVLGEKPDAFILHHRHAEVGWQIPVESERFQVPAVAFACDEIVCLTKVSNGRDNAADIQVKLQRETYTATVSAPEQSQQAFLIFVRTEASQWQQWFPAARIKDDCRKMIGNLRMCTNPLGVNILNVVQALYAQNTVGGEAVAVTVNNNNLHVYPVVVNTVPPQRRTVTFYASSDIKTDLNRVEFVVLQKSTKQVKLCNSDTVQGDETVQSGEIVLDKACWQLNEGREESAEMAFELRLKTGKLIAAGSERFIALEQMSPAQVQEEIRRMKENDTWQGTPLQRTWPIPAEALPYLKGAEDLTLHVTHLGDGPALKVGSFFVILQLKRDEND